MTHAVTSYEAALLLIMHVHVNIILGCRQDFGNEKVNNVTREACHEILHISFSTWHTS